MEKNVWERYPQKPNVIVLFLGDGVYGLQARLFLFCLVDLQQYFIQDCIKRYISMQESG
jgi:hypothetical protein